MKPEKHGAAAVKRKPDSADWTIDQGWERYTAEEHAVWKTLFERQSKLLPGRACDEFVQGMRELPIGADQIPDFRRLSDVLMKRTGWQVVAVPGLVPGRRVLRPPRQPPLPGRPVHPQAGPARLPRGARRLPRRLRPRAAADASR